VHPYHQHGHRGEPAHTIENGGPTEPEKILFALDQAAEQRREHRDQAHHEQEPQRHRVVDFIVGDQPFPKNNRQHDEAQPESNEKFDDAAHCPRQHRALLLINRRDGLLGENRLQAQRRNRHLPQRVHQRHEHSVLGFASGGILRHPLRRGLNQEHEAAASNRGDQHPCALAKKRELVFLHGNSCKKIVSTAMARSSERTEIHSSAVCAWAMSPGPNSTAGVPPRANTDASLK
jgi:hypothetical protein